MHKHKPVFHAEVDMFGDFLKQDFDSNPSKIMQKWSPVAENIFTELNFDKLNYLDKKMILFYFEWIAMHDNHNIKNDYNEVAMNVHSFKVLMDELINSPKLNYPIVNKVYNPFLNKMRYEVSKDGQNIIMDEFYKNDEGFLLELYPDKFIEAVGMKQTSRERKLNDILDNADSD